MPDFVHLHNHSDFSLLDGAATIEKLVAKAKSLGMTRLALTDHGNMFGALKFYKECLRNEIKPIVGCEFYVAPESRHIKSGGISGDSGERYNHLVLLAKNRTGYKNLIRLSSLGYTEGFYYKPRIDEELLLKYSEGIVASSACLAGEIPKLLLQGREEEAAKRAHFYQDVYGKGNYFLEVQDHGIPEQRAANRGIVEIAKRTGIPVIASNDIHYLDQSDANAQDILICIDTGKKKGDSNRLKFQSDQFYMKSGEEMERMFGEIPDSLSNTVRIAEMAELEIDLPGPMLPDYQIPKGFSSPEDYLRHLTYEGLKERYDVNENIRARADHELQVIIAMGFTGYFLIVWDFIHYARTHDIPVGPGRGSGAGSIVAYALKITDIDPLKYGLLFERFLNPERISMPDFDIDFCFERRQEVIDYVTRKYGTDKVGQIITFGTLKARAVIRDVARVLDIPYAESDRIAKLVPQGPKIDLEKALGLEPKLKEVIERGGNYGELIDVSRKLEGLNRHASTHAAGIVIGKDALTEFVPLYRDPKTGSISTQYTMGMLEECGLVKMDFLGLKTLTLIKNTVDLIQKRGTDVDIDAVPEDDEKTFELLGEGKSKCIFQFESSGMQGILRQAKPNCIEDLIALNALYRPGPMENIPQFIDAKWGRKPIRYPHPTLEKVLKETYGVIVYQEQVMEIVRIIAGFTLGQADILRRAMGKKKLKEMERLKKDFLQGAAEKGISEKEAEKIFTLLEPFAGYGFNKSHAAAYSVLAYKTAYLKANYPAEFMAANLTNEINFTDKLTEYISESRDMGIDLLPPDVNRSDKYFSVVDGKIIYGLVGIKNVGEGAVDEILRARGEGGPFKSFVDFLERVDLKTVNHKVLEALIQSGLFDSIEPGRAELCYNLDTLTAFVAAKKESAQFGQSSLFEESEEEAFSQIELKQVEEWPESEILRYEKEHLGFYFSGHPLDKYRDLWKKAVTLDLSKPERHNPDKMYNLIGIVKGIREIQTKKGKPMAFGQIEDFNGSIEVIFFPSVWEKDRYRVQPDGIYALQGKLDISKDDEPKLKVEAILNPEELTVEESADIHIRLRPDCHEEELFGLRSTFFSYPGNARIFLHLRNSVPEKEIVIKVSPQITVSSQDEVIRELKSIPKIEDVWRT
jgi:DNA polymerase III subunit alpha